MNGQSRKVKNPLLSAAGIGFPFEQYTQNAVLMPVTPATPAVLRDDVEIDNFVGQEPTQSKDLTAESSGNIEFPASSTTFNAPPTSEEPKDQTQSQPQKQSYFTSILSSLPNLSLSAIKGELTQSSSGHQSQDNLRSPPQVNPYAQNPHGPPPEATSYLTIDPRDPRRTQAPGPAQDPHPPAANIFPPSCPSVPPSVPLSTGGSVSYRLGNQRRLKYVPPPDLTSSSGKQYPTPSPQGFPPVQPAYQAHPTIFNPNAVAEQTPTYTVTPQNLGNTPIDQPLTTPDQHSRNSSLHGSFRSSPSLQQVSQNQNPYYETQFASGPPGFSASASKLIPARVPEPATPQNTPANVSFAGFAGYRHQDPLTTSGYDKDPFKNISESSTPSEVKDNISESGRREAFTASSTTDQTFTPISAARVTEKLEHLLAEREENPSAALLEFSEPAETDARKESEQIADLANDALSDVDLGEEPQETLKEATQLLSTVNESASAAETSVVHSASLQQQYYSEPAPALPGAHFFDRQSDKKPTQKPEATVTTAYPDPSPYPTNPGAFFDSFANSKKYSYPKPSDASLEKPKEPAETPIQPFVGFQQNQPPQPAQSFWTPNQSSFAAVQEQPPPVQSFWTPNQSSFTAAQEQPPPPTFYNPAQFMTESTVAPPVAANVYNPAGEKPIQVQSYFDTAVSQTSKPVSGNSGFHPPSTVSATATVPEPTDPATLSPVQTTVNPHLGRTSPNTVPPSLQALATGEPVRKMNYYPVNHHWFHRKVVEDKVLWLPFSILDSEQLEKVYESNDISPETRVATDGGRYDVDILRRRKSPIYWSGPATEVRRCSWFYKVPSDPHYLPYDETVAQRLEEEYKHVYTTGDYNRRIDLSNGEYIVFHSDVIQVHYLPATSSEMAASWGNSAGSEESTYLQGADMRPRTVERGLPDIFKLDYGEPEKIDHLLFLVHGIGSVCDLKFRTVEEVVDEFRSISLQLLETHYCSAGRRRAVNRIEVLPISWHATLHSEDTGIDKKLHAITLESIPKLRHFTNDTLLDILFYTSPIYCQTIIKTVGDEMNRLFAVFRERNPTFDGGIYLGGHSLGSLILFDLLCHQRPENSEEEEETEEGTNGQAKDDDHLGPVKPLPAPVLKRRLSKKISYVMGAAGTGQPFIHYPQLNFHPRAFFALGSPIGMFVTVRGIDTLGEDFALPTCPAFFNIFHPFDPVAYRVESLINPDAHKFRPMLIPHHKGRKRMHLELKEAMARVGAELKEKLLSSVRNTWNSVYQLTLFYKSETQALEREIEKVVEEQLNKQSVVPEQNNDDGGADLKVGKLNGGRRIDYVLQEAPFEYINEYLFALTSHVCYWESEDTMLMILKEIYGSMGIQADAQLPQKTLSIERVTPSASSSLAPTSGVNDMSNSHPVLGVDVTAPISGKPVGPPPKTGFVRKS